jgi:hypothetical protein
MPSGTTLTPTWFAAKLQANLSRFPVVFPVEADFHLPGETCRRSFSGSKFNHVGV